MDAYTNEVLEGKYINDSYSVASISKIMTAIIALESDRLFDVIVVDDIIKTIEGSSLYLSIGDQITIIDLVYGLLLRSGNDAAVLNALCSSALNRLVLPQMVVLGSLSIGGTINKVEELTSVLQVAFDAGAKRILIPMSSAVDIATVPSDLFTKFQISFYSSAEDAVIKALGIE